MRESYLRYYVDEVKLDGNIVHATYLRNLIAIKRQINMHKTIKKYTFNKHKSNLKSILIPKDSTLK